MSESENNNLQDTVREYWEIKAKAEEDLENKIMDFDTVHAELSSIEDKVLTMKSQFLDLDSKDVMVCLNGLQQKMLENNKKIKDLNKEIQHYTERSNSDAYLELFTENESLKKDNH